jgi:hypothetical protein
MEFWVGVGLLVLVWWALGRPGADLALARDGLHVGLIFACVFCVCRTTLKALAIWRSR